MKFKVNNLQEGLLTKKKKSDSAFLAGFNSLAGIYFVLQEF